MSDKIHLKIDQDLEDIMPQFLENRNKDVTKITEFLVADDVENIKVIAHKMAGNAGGYGLDHLGDIGAQMEDACKAKDMETVKTLFDEMKNYLNSIEIEYIEMDE